MSDLAIEIQGLTKRFDAVQAVNDLSLVVRQGEMFGVVGPDGAGKTTTMRMLCGILRPTSGHARVLGYDLGSDLKEIKRRIGYLSQRFSLYGDLTIDENISFFAEVHGVREHRKRREELLEFTRLTPFRDRLAERLSGGMKQKLALACTLIHTPQIIFLDEPTTGVDPVSRRDFWKILSSLLKSGITIFMTTPYLDEAERCTRVGLMNDGRLMAVDAPQALKALMKGTLVEIVCGQVRRAASVLRGSSEEVQAFGDRLNVVVQDPERAIPAIQAQLRDAGIDVTGLRVVPPSLENVFISLLKTEAPSPPPPSTPLRTS
ncbi:MAG: ABC transporter ATP-binding protein [Candidatus Latescibacteria bacterium]|nr:ABC transporter ATP-binding protein [Candidatus Latescibacterota bacterium]